MGVDLRHGSHVLFFVVVLGAISYGIGWVFVQLFPDLPFWVEGVSPLTAYGVLFGLFNKIAWRWSVFRWLGIVTVPDVRGRWLGEQTSSYTQEGKHRTSRVIMEVTQTFSGVEVAVYYHRWSSKITVAQFVEIEHVPTLLIMFDAERKVSFEDESDNALRGVTKLALQPDGKLHGSYFNGAGRHGELTYRRTSYRLAHTFNALPAGAVDQR